MMTLRHKTGKNIWLYGLVLFCMLAYLAVFACLNLRTLERFCNPDVYADMQVAKMMWEQKTLFPEGWIFGNQYYIIATPVLAALIYGITGNINLAMGLATEVMTLLIFLSLLWMLRSFHRDYLSYLVCCLLLMATQMEPISAISINILFLFTQASFYACYLITMFVTFGDYIRSFQTEKIRPGTWILSLVLCFATGMQSLRQMVVMVLPILACELFQALRRMLQGKKPWDRTNRLCLIRAVSYVAANLAGKLTMDSLHVASASIYGQMQTVPLAQMGQRFAPIGTSLAEITGLSYVLGGKSSVLFAVAAIAWILLVIWAGVLWLRRIHRQESGLELCWLLSLVGMIGVSLSTVVLDITLRGVYLFTWFPLVGFSAMMILEKLSRKLKTGLICLICAISMGSLFSCYGSSAEIILFRQNIAPAQLCQWAMDNGYEYVYGDYWMAAPQIAVWSEGKMEAGCWNDPDYVYQIERFNTRQDIYGDEENEKAIYVFTSYDEQAGLGAAQERGVTLEKVAEYGIYSAYVSPEPLMYKPQKTE